MAESKTNLLGMTQAQLEAFFLELGEKKFRATQVMQWIHARGVDDFAAMSDLGKALRGKLAEVAEIRAPRIVHSEFSKDGTRKWVLEMDGGGKVETVFIPEAVCPSDPPPNSGANTTPLAYVVNAGSNTVFDGRLINGREFGVFMNHGPGASANLQCCISSPPIPSRNLRRPGWSQGAAA